MNGTADGEECDARERSGTSFIGKRCHHPVLTKDVSVRVPQGSPNLTIGRTLVVVVSVARPMREVEPKPVGRPVGSRAREWIRMLEIGVYGSKAELARGEGVSRAAVTKGLKAIET